MDGIHATGGGGGGRHDTMKTGRWRYVPLSLSAISAIGAFGAPQKTHVPPRLGGTNGDPKYVLRKQEAVDR